jgi:hypothetical protein
VPSLHEVSYVHILDTQPASRRTPSAFGTLHIGNLRPLSETFAVAEGSGEKLERQPLMVVPTMTGFWGFVGNSLVAGCRLCEGFLPVTGEPPASNLGLRNRSRAGTRVCRSTCVHWRKWSIQRSLEVPKTGGANVGFRSLPGHSEWPSGYGCHCSECCCTPQ